MPFRAMRCLICLLGLLPTLLNTSYGADAADTVLTGGKIITADSQDRIVEALAIKDGRVAAVGSAAEMAKRIGPRTKVIRLAGKTVVPGLIETHCHPLGAGRAALTQEYVELASVAELQDWIRKAAAKIPPGTWIRTPRTDITRIAERRHPTPAELDDACRTHPVVFTAARKHALNTLGFKLLGITRENPRLEGARVILDDQGNPAILVGGDAQIRKLIPATEFTDEQTRDALVKVLGVYNSVGITSIFDRANSLQGYRTYEALRDEGRLTVRTTVTFRSQFRSGEDVEKYVTQLGLKPGDGDQWVKPGPLKITVDGGIHWGNTFLREPYGEKRVAFYRLQDPEYRGDLRFTVERMTDVFAAGARLGWQMCCHVTGDAGVDRVLDALEAAHAKTPLDDRRFTLVHAYFPAVDSVRRASRLGVCADTQSYLYYKDSDAMATVYGSDWAERFIGLGDWLRGGVPTAINSDHMIGLDPDHAMNSFNPFLQMYIAVSRKNQRGRVYGRHQRISRMQALRCMTTTAAYLSFDEKKTGSLEPGKVADLAVLDRDYLTCPEEEIRRIKVLMTLVNGKKVFTRKAGSSRD